MKTYNLREPCKTCYYKATSGQMYEPCFLCLQSYGMFGHKKKMFDSWIDDKLSDIDVEYIIEQKRKRFSDLIDSDPELSKMFTDIAKQIKRGLLC